MDPASWTAKDLSPTPVPSWAMLTGSRQLCYSTVILMWRPCGAGAEEITAASLVVETTLAMC